MTTPQIKTLEDVVKLEATVASYHVARTALRLGVLQRLSEGQRTAEQLAEALRFNVRATRLFLDALCETGLTERYGFDFALSPMGRMLGEAVSLDDGHWDRLGEFVRGGSLSGSSDGLSGAGFSNETGTGAEPFHQQWMQTPAALDAAEVLDVGRSRRGLKILEVGGGSAVFSVTLAHRDPDSLFVLMDTELRLGQARATAESVGLENQFRFVPCDPLRPPVVEPEYDLIIRAGGLHEHSEETGAGWIQKLASGLKPAGEIAIIDWFAGQPKGERTLAFYALELGLRVPGAQLHRPQLVRDWLHAAGLSQVRFAHLPSPPHIWGLVLAEKVRS